MLFGCSRRKGKGERDRESSSSHEESPGEESHVKRHYQGHFTRLYFEISSKSKSLFEIGYTHSLQHIILPLILTNFLKIKSKK